MCPGKNSRGSRGRSRAPGVTPGAYSLKPSGGRKPGPGKIKPHHVSTCEQSKVPSINLKFPTTLEVSGDIPTLQIRQTEAQQV